MCMHGTCISCKVLAHHSLEIKHEMRTALLFIRVEASLTVTSKCMHICIPCIKNDDEAFGMDNVLAALPSPDLGFDENISHARNIDNKIKPRMINFIDDPMDMENQDYMKALNMTNEERLLSLEYMLDEIDQTF